MLEHTKPTFSNEINSQLWKGANKQTKTRKKASETGKRMFLRNWSYPSLVQHSNMSYHTNLHVILQVMVFRKRISFSIFYTAEMTECTTEAFIVLQNIWCLPLLDTDHQCWRTSRLTQHIGHLTLSSIDSDVKNNLFCTNTKPAPRLHLLIEALFYRWQLTGAVWEAEAQF